MRAAFIHGPYDVRLGELALRPGPGQILVEVAAVGICGSDLHYYKEGGIGAAARIRAPFVPGHEIAARLLEPLPEQGLAAGDLVAIDPARPCRRCEWCHRGHVNLCPQVIFTGAPPHHGAMAERLATTPEQVVPLPPGFTPDQVAMLEPLGVCIHALDLARPQYWESVAVLGCGPIGLGIVDLCRLAGVAELYAIDPVAHRRDAAARFGARAVADRPAALADWTGGRGVDLVIEATNAPEGFQHAAEAVRIGGRVVLVGIPDGDAYRLEAALARRKGLTVRFSRRMGEVYPRAIRLAAAGRVDLDGLITHRIGLDAVPDAFALLAGCQDGVIKVMVRP